MSTGHLEQLAVSKGGNWCVIGDDCDEVKWSEKVVEYILEKCCKNRSYFRIVLISLDYNLVNSIIQSIIESVADQIEVVVFHEWSEFMTASESLLSFQTDHQAAMQGIFLLSLSELILTMGVKSLRSDITRITSKVHESTFEQKKFNTTLFVTALHSSLHQINSINHIASMFHSTVTVVPNNSPLMSASVAAELKILRKAAGTTKITEQQELMRWSNGYSLEHIVSDQSSRIVHGKNTGSVTANVDKESITAATAPVESEIQNHAIRKLNSRLITFDSTDPEFDEDSDPDADLDL